MALHTCLSQVVHSYALTGLSSNPFQSLRTTSHLTVQQRQYTDQQHKASNDYAGLRSEQCRPAPGGPSSNSEGQAPSCLSPHADRISPRMSSIRSATPAVNMIGIMQDKWLEHLLVAKVLPTVTFMLGICPLNIRPLHCSCDIKQNTAVTGYILYCHCEYWAEASRGYAPRSRQGGGSLKSCRAREASRQAHLTSACQSGR